MVGVGQEHAHAPRPREQPHLSSTAACAREPFGAFCSVGVLFGFPVSSCVHASGSRVGLRARSNAPLAHNGVCFVSRPRHPSRRPRGVALSFHHVLVQHVPCPRNSRMKECLYLYFQHPDVPRVEGDTALLCTATSEVLLRSNKHQAHARVCRVSLRPVTTVQRSGHSPLSAASACTVPASTMTTGTPPAATRAAALSFAATYTREARPESTTERRAELRARSARRPPPPSRRAPPSASAASRPPRQTGRRRSGGGALRRPRRAGGRRCRPRL